MCALFSAASSGDHLPHCAQRLTNLAAQDSCSHPPDCAPAGCLHVCLLLAKQMRQSEVRQLRQTGRSAKVHEPHTEAYKQPLHHAGSQPAPPTASMPPSKVRLTACGSCARLCYLFRVCNSHVQPIQHTDCPTLQTYPRRSRFSVLMRTLCGLMSVGAEEKAGGQGKGSS